VSEPPTAPPPYNGEPDAAAPRSAQPRAQTGRSHLRRTLARALLVGGIALALAQALPELLPHEHELVFDLGASSPPVRTLEFTWTPQGDTRPTGGVTLNLAGAGARRVRHTLVAPEGTYVLHLTLQRAAPGAGADSTTRTTYVRRVSLEGGETTVLLHRPHP
jgi:hypothetical protein